MNLVTRRKRLLDLVKTQTSSVVDCINLIGNLTRAKKFNRNMELYTVHHLHVYCCYCT